MSLYCSSSSDGMPGCTLLCMEVIVHAMLVHASAICDIETLVGLQVGPTFGKQHLFAHPIIRPHCTMPYAPHCTMPYAPHVVAC